MPNEITPETPPCPFCRSHNLRISYWWDDDGSWPAVECENCKGAAPYDIWMRLGRQPVTPTLNPPALLRRQAG